MPRRSSGHMARLTSPSFSSRRDGARERALAEMDGSGQFLHAGTLPAVTSESLEDLELAHPETVRGQRVVECAARPRVLSEQLAPRV